jgi:tRNA_anti-like
MKRKGKTVIIFLLLLAVLAAGFGYYLFNKGPMDVKNSEALKVNAIELYQLLSTDSASGLKKYAGKVLEVDGNVNSVSVNQKKEKVILLRTNTENGYVNCTMEEPAEVKVNDKVTIKGICSGIGQGDEDLGIKGDVYLTRCFLKK